MARGYPDRFGQQQFTQLGVFTLTSASMNANASAEVSVASVSGKGQLHTVLLGIDDTAIADDDVVKIKVDGSVIFNYSIGFMRKYILSSNPDKLMYLTYYSLDGFAFYVVVPGGITFQSSFEVRFQELYGRTPALICYIYHHAVQ